MSYFRPWHCGPYAFWLGLALLFLPGAVCWAAADEVDFAHQIVPILKTHCIKCHSGPQQEGGFSLNDRETILSGGDSGPVVVLQDVAASELHRRVVSTDEGERMPPEGAGLSPEQAVLLARWIDQGLPWEPGFSFAPSSYEPPLRPRRPELPAGDPQRPHPIDRLLDHELGERQQPLPAGISDEVFLRRVTLDLVGRLPTPEQRAAFLGDTASDKRERWIEQLLDDEVAYAEHWLTFWNDLLRNDYTGTGFITGGRTQITAWLYQALLENMPFDQFVRELVAPPTDASAGFINGIRWRGEVSAGQTVEIQFAQSIGQTFLGINLKCASCHDSFVDRWTLDEAFSLAAVYSQRPLELHRCDKPLGKTAQPGWLFPELGQIDATADRATRLQQLAGLMTHPENGRLARTIVNRLWHRLMGRGIVHPVDAMQSPPWNADLLDYLAMDLTEHGYDLKRTMRLIATSQAYQAEVEAVSESAALGGYRYAGPRARRMTAEQFLDAVWQLTGAGPTTIDAPIQRRLPDGPAAGQPLNARWIWNRGDATQSAGGETVAFRYRWELPSLPATAVAAISCDNSYQVYLNGQRIGQGEQWETPDLVSLDGLVVGQNELLIVGRNGGSGPNPAGLFCAVRTIDSAGMVENWGTGSGWEWAAVTESDSSGSATPPAVREPWQAAVPVEHAGIWAPRVEPLVQALLDRGQLGSAAQARASLVKSDFLMRSLGRPNRDQIVTERPQELTTLEAIDLSIGETLDGYLQQGARRLQQQSWESSTDLVRWVFHHGLSREPTAAELAVLTDPGDAVLSSQDIADLLWAVIMLPEFQTVR